MTSLNSAGFRGKALLAKDATNRAVRTFIQAVAVEILAVVGPAVYEMLSDGDTEWNWNVWTSLARTAGLTALAYVMRRFLDPAKFVPTPLPPIVAGEPSDHDPDGTL